MLGAVTVTVAVALSIVICVALWESHGQGGLSVGGSREAATIHAQELAVLGDGGEVRLQGRAPRSRAILVAGRPLREPVARYGPFVMNTREELHQAFADFQSGKF